MHRLISFFQPDSTTQRRRIFVVHGIGGIGKTQLCAEFARQTREQFTATFWLDGSSKDALLRAMAQAARRIPGRQIPQTTEGAHVETAQLAEQFLQWLSLPANTQWLLVIDNVDREWQSTVEDPQAYDYRKHLPQADHGSVLITTRLARLKQPKASLHLQSVDDGSARQMIETRAGATVPGMFLLSNTTIQGRQ